MIRSTVKVGDIVAIMFPNQVMEWTCVEDKGNSTIVLRSPNGVREVQTLPVLRKMVREGNIRIHARWGML